MQKTIFSNKEKFQCVNHPMPRSIGVQVHAPHIGAISNTLCEISTEYLLLNTASRNTYSTLDEVNNNTKKQTVSLISQIDGIMEELQEHKERLKVTLTEIDSDHLNLDELAQNQIYPNSYQS